MRPWMSVARQPVLLASVVLLACGEETGPGGQTPPVAEVIMTASQSVIVVGGETQLLAVATDAAGDSLPEAELTWSSSDAGRATVSPAGLVTGVSEGEVEITAEAGGRSASTVLQIRIVAFESVSGGLSHTCGLTGEGEAFCWGRGDHGQLGTADTLRTWSPLPVRTALRFSSISAGFEHTCAITTQGAAYCWGLNQGGELGLGVADAELRLTPEPVVGGIAWAEVDADVGRTCGLDVNGTAYCWGRGVYGSLGNGSDLSVETSPTAVIGNHLFGSIGLGDLHSCATGLDQVTYCWGLKDVGRLGNPAAPGISLEPIAIEGALDLAGITVGQAHTCGIEASGDTYCWGINGSVGSPGASGESPVQVVGGHLFNQLSAGAYHTCGVTAANQAFCWGVNGAGQVGNGTEGETPEISPVGVIGGHGWVRIAAGAGHTCGIAMDGMLYCWGDNGEGEVGVHHPGVGHGVEIPTLIPALVVGQR